jgi:hypothetical protein
MMTSYRSPIGYIVGRDEHFARSESLIALDDDKAIIKAKSLIADLDIELWSGDRFVIRLSHKDAP